MLALPVASVATAVTGLSPSVTETLASATGWFFSSITEICTVAGRSVACAKFIGRQQNTATSPSKASRRLDPRRVSAAGAVHDCDSAKQSITFIESK